MAPRVHFAPLPAGGDALAPPDPRPGLQALARALGLANGAPGTWAVKTHLGPPHRPAAVEPAWAAAVAGDLPGRTAFCFDTLSITTAGLETAPAQRELAGVKGYATAPGASGPPFVVADDPEAGPSLPVAAPDGSALADHALGAALAGADRLAVLTPIRPHPHLGLFGAVATAGIGLADEASTLALHRGIRPAVDTPLCAGCGVCMTVCLADAIRLNAGRAYIDHERCTGCGECMNVCFMAGINPEEAARVPAFQAQVADAAAAAVRRVTGGGPGRAVYWNFLVRLEQQAGGTRRRSVRREGDLGVMASTDPVALDQATWDRLAAWAGGELKAWSGFKQLPEALLARAEAVGLGSRAYELVTV